jgi:hypothetical protein
VVWLAAAPAGGHPPPTASGADPRAQGVLPSGPERSALRPRRLDAAERLRRRLRYLPKVAESAASDHPGAPRGLGLAAVHATDLPPAAGQGDSGATSRAKGPGGRDRQARPPAAAVTARAWAAARCCSSLTSGHLGLTAPAQAGGSRDPAAEPFLVCNVGPFGVFVGASVLRLTAMDLTSDVSISSSQMRRARRRAVRVVSLWSIRFFFIYRKEFSRSAYAFLYGIVLCTGFGFTLLFTTLEE